MAAVMVGPLRANAQRLQGTRRVDDAGGVCRIIDGHRLQRNSNRDALWIPDPMVRSDVNTQRRDGWY